jgi:membrane protein
VALRGWWRDSAFRDYAARAWGKRAKEDLFFLASGIAFNILLAAIPFCLVLVSGLGYALNMSAGESMARMSTLIDRLLPPESAAGTAAPLLHLLLTDITRASAKVGIYSAICFVWFTTRLFASLRGVLANVFDTEAERGLVEAKLFDVQVTVAATLLVVAYTLLNAYLAIATTRGVRLLAAIGVQRSAMGMLAYSVGQLIAFAVVLALLFALYRYLPKRRIPPRVALVAATMGAVAFEIVKVLFGFYLRHFNPASLYTATLAAIVVVLVWVYCLAAIFVVGAEVGQTYALRRAGGRRHPAPA